MSPKAIAREYINEIQPYLGGIDLYAFLSVVTKNPIKVRSEPMQTNI
jgi:hypothetical protein